jgi:DNA-binding SARP family transcriptional activator/tetratricopeptide (TPR) repeat protein
MINRMAPPSQTSTAQPDSDYLQEGNRPAAHALVRFHLFGVMRVTTHHGVDILPETREAQALLGCLCLAHDGRISSSDLGNLLWDLPPDAEFADRLEAAIQNVRSTWRSLRSDLLRIQDGYLKLDLRRCWVDAVTVLKSTRFVHDDAYCDLSVGLEGELLEGLDGVSVAFDGWLRQQRSRLKAEMQRWLAEKLDSVERTTGDPVQITALARGLVLLDPEDDRASIALTYALTETGQYALALREYERSRSLWRPGTFEKFGHEATALHETILTCAAIEERVTGETIRSAHRKRGPAGPMPLLKCYRTRIGILPFLAGGSSGESQIALSACNDIAAAMERFGWFEIIRPDTMVRDPGTSSAVGDRREHGELDYIVDGSVSHNGKDFAISVRILDTGQYARPVWSDRFSVGDDQVDRFSNLLAHRLVARAAPFILYLEGRPRPKRRRGTAGLLLLAIQLMHTMDRRRYEEAGQLIRCALELGDARAFAWVAHWSVYHVGQGWSKDAAGTIRMAQQYGLKAVQLDPGNSEALGIYAHVCSFLSREFDSARRMFDRSLQKNPSSPFVLALSSPTYCYMGEPDTALARFRTYRELAPFDPFFHVFQHFYTIALTFKGDYDRAVRVGQRAIENNPGFTNGYKHVIAALGHLGRPEEAQRYLVRLLSLEPGFTMGQFAKSYPFKHARDRDRYLEGLRLAGAPE